MSFYEGQRPDPDKLVHQYSADYTDWEDEGAPSFSNGRMMLIVAENLGDGGNCVGAQITILDGEFLNVKKAATNGLTMHEKMKNRERNHGLSSVIR